jgi:predicted RecB family nuclease
VQRIEAGLVLSPTDLTKHLACPHITTLDLLAVDGHAYPGTPDDALELIFALGSVHEDGYLQSLRDQGRSIVTIEAASAAVSRADRETETLAAMCTGVDVIYQGTFYDGVWGGQADFLLRTERPSALGLWSYDIADTKLARRLTVAALLQLATYADRLTVLQGVEPSKLLVVTGDGQERPWKLIDVAAFARRARARLLGAVEIRPVTAPVPVAHCGQCRWIDRCTRHWHDEDDLSLVAFMRGDHRDALRDAGITTLAALAGARADQLPRRIGQTSRERLVQQAALQLTERETRKPLYELLPPTPRMGLLRLPPPDAGDLYLDFEGDPYAEGGLGREYLAGLGDVDRGFIAIWAHTAEQERALTVDLVDRLLAHWEQHPGMHVYHYAPYETTALKRLVNRYGIREAELDQLLRGERFVDLYAVVRQGVRISKGSYSIKKLEAFYWGHIRSQNPDVANAMSSVIAYEKWTAQPDDVTLGQIEAYNKDDVVSTLDLHRWLEDRRTDLETTYGPQSRWAGGELARPVSAGEQAEIDLAARLEEAGEPLLAALVGYHRREARPAYWDMFRLEDLDDDELVDDSAALGGLSAPTAVGILKKSTLYRYEFPAQYTKVQIGDTVYDVDSHKTAGTVHALDPEEGYIVVRRKDAPRQSRGFTEKQVLGDQIIRDALAAVAHDRLTHQPCLGGALLDRAVPAKLTDVVEAGLSLSGQVLAVQGPPGSGKTTTGAKLIRTLLDAGLIVGVTATSHAVIGNMLTVVGRPGMQRCDAEQHCGHAGITRADRTTDVVNAVAGGCQLVGGTAWLWSDPAVAGLLDVLVIDEAGQVSLANAIAVTRAARSLVLLGDPQQLAQPTQAVHPAGAAVSALGHLLDGHDTIATDRGIFLGVTWRMHPEIAAYVSDLVYDGRLTAGPGQEQQAVRAAGPITGSGLRVVDVNHLGNAAASPQEVTVVLALWKQLTAGTFTDRDGCTRPMTAADVLIVAPYNNQVSLIQAAVPMARVGTVDRFQGQEAPVVIYSMTSSTAEDAPRGIDFLYDVHRLNVAISRAQALTVVVMNCRLLDADVHTPEQLGQVNALCRLVESSGLRSA